MHLNLTSQTILYCATIVLGISPLHCSSTVLAQEHELEAFVGKESIGFLVLEQPQAFLESIERFPFFTSGRFERLLEILEDPEFEIFSSENLEQLRRQWSEFKNIFASIEEVAVIVHPFEDKGKSFFFDDVFYAPENVPKFSVVINGSPESSQQLQRFLQDVRSLAQATLSPNLFATQKDTLAPDTKAPLEAESPFESDAVAYNFRAYSKLASAVMEIIEDCTIKCTDNFVIVSNDSHRCAELADRLSSVKDKKFRSLSRQRSYQRVQKLLDNPSDSPALRGFFAPKNIPELGAYLITNTLSFPAKSLPAGGFLLSVNPQSDGVSTPAGEFQPILESSFVMTFTQPATEYAKVIQSFRPIETIPNFTHPVFNYKAIGFDAQERLDAFAETIAIHNAEDATEDDSSVGDSSVGESEEPEFNDFNDFEIYGLVGEPKTFDPTPIVGFTDASIEMWYGDNENPALGGWVKMHPVSDAEKMDLFFDQWIAAENLYQEPEDHYTEVESHYGRLFVRASARDGASQLSGDDQGQDNADPRNEDLDSSRENLLQFEPELFLSDQWLISTDHNTMKRLLESLYDAPTQPNTFAEIFEAAKKHNNDRPPVKINYRVTGQIRGQNKTMQYRYIEGKYDQNQRDGTLLGLAEEEKDEFGLYPFESKEDAIAACWQLFFDAARDTFGISIRLLSVEENHVRIFAETYAKVNSETTETK